MATLATITKTNNIIYVNANPISATIDDINQFYIELEREIKSTFGNFILIVDLSSVKWLEADARKQMAIKSDALYAKYSATYIGKILVFKNTLIRSMVNLFNLASKKSSPQHITKTIEEAEKIAYELFYTHEKEANSTI